MPAAADVGADARYEAGAGGRQILRVARALRSAPAGIDGAAVHRQRGGGAARPAQVVHDLPVTSGGRAVVSQPLPPLSHTYAPPVTQCLTLRGSARKGAMKRGVGVAGIRRVQEREARGRDLRPGGDRSVAASSRRSVVLHMSLSVYSETTLSPFRGSTMLSPPSPPNGETMSAEPGEDRRHAVVLHAAPDRGAGAMPELGANRCPTRVVVLQRVQRRVQVVPAG